MKTALEVERGYHPFELPLQKLRLLTSCCISHLVALEWGWLVQKITKVGILPVNLQPSFLWIKIPSRHQGGHAKFAMFSSKSLRERGDEADSLLLLAGVDGGRKRRQEYWQIPFHSSLQLFGAGSNRRIGVWHWDGQALPFTTDVDLSE